MTLNYIFHLSDLHIRNGDKIQSRFDEYNNVFKETVISISKQISTLKLTFNDFIIIITGDVFHNKNVIGNYGLSLYKTFIQELTKLGRVIIYHGQHDFNQSEINHPTLVSSSSFDITNLTVLNYTSSFVIDDIGFSYVSITDTLDIFKNSGRVQDLPQFPSIKEMVKYKVALFHGSFASAKLFNGDVFRDDCNPYPLEWVQDFDFVMLGDVHKRQVAIYKKKTYYGYSGSLIQQSFGEDLIEHGYLLWDLNNKKIKEINVFNELGLINIKQNEKEEILIRINGKYELLLEDVIKTNGELFPQKLEIKTFSKINFHNLNNLLKSYNITFNIISRLTDTDDNKNDNKKEIHDDEQFINITDNSFILDYFNKYLSPDNYKLFIDIINDKTKLLFDICKYPEELHDDCLKKNKELNNYICQCIKNEDSKHNKPSFLIRYLEWESLLCYENKNWINMSDLDAKTFMIKAGNGRGKTAIYDILTLAIWGKITTLKQNTSLSVGIINDKKKNAYTIVDIELDGTIYRIEREFARKTETTTLHIKHKLLYKFIDYNNNHLQLLKKETACDSTVIELFGTIETFLSSSMITQNVDCDILKLKPIECLAIIDKSCNIEYIYHLYNLFKTAINKYKDFRKNVESKKQVYEKLVSTNKIDVISEEQIATNKQLLEELTLQHDELITSFNSIPVDISNDSINTILKTDYDKLIIDLQIDYDENKHNLYKEQYGELKCLLKDELDLLKLKELYNPSIIIDETNKKIKPCELVFINNESDLLKQYQTDKYYNYDINIYNPDDLDTLKSKYKDLEIRYKEIVVKQPIKVDDPKITKDEHLKLVYKVYKSVEELNSYISTNSKKYKTNGSNNDELLTYDNYKKILEKEIVLKEKIKIKKEKIINLEKDFKLLFKKQQETEIKNKPLTPISLKSSISISLAIKKININSIIKQISIDEQIINNYFQQKDILEKLENELNTYNQELYLFASKDEYKYNPSCEFCCKRHWVCRIKELEIIINKLETDVKLQNDEINKLEDCFKISYQRNDNNIKIKDEYDVLNEWYDYYKSQEAYTKITKELNNNITNKDIINKEIIKETCEITDIDIYYQQFNNISYDLYEILLNIDLYDNYKHWFDMYEQINIDYNDVKIKITELEDYINYTTNIKPRLTNLKVLNELYNDWLDYEYKFKIIKANELFTLRTIIELYDKYLDYDKNNKLKPFIETKIKLNDEIKIIEIKIKEINNLIIKSSTINNYNKDNINDYDNLFNILNDLDSILNILEIIIANFQTFRIELYDKYVLNRLCSRANNIIKSLCHKNTRPFKLDYLTTIVKDTIHINWLINNDEYKKQIISVSQSSGYQHFVISLALRMSLFTNKHEIKCNQLFIDEGFINFDKDNLSIVPMFIKNLLSYFNNIIVVSHIDLIQDNIDEIVEIKYNKITSVSSIEYNDYKKVIKNKK